MRRQYLIRFFETFKGGVSVKELKQLSPDDVLTFFLKYANDNGSSSRRSMQATLRTFFRFCQSNGYTKRDLAQSIPTLRSYKLSTLPNSLSEKNAQKLISNIDRSTKAGKRDYAIIQLLYTYGIRGGQIRALRFEDICWNKDQIHFSALKHGKDILQPLTENVGNSILDYIQHARPSLPAKEVFLSSRAPYQALQRSSTLSAIIAKHAKKNNIKSSGYGANIFRHAFATRMLAQGNPLKSIADMIGHCSIQTTSIYAKVDFQNLNKVPLDWPKEVL